MRILVSGWQRRSVLLLLLFFFCEKNLFAFFSSSFFLFSFSAKRNTQIKHLGTGIPKSKQCFDQTESARRRKRTEEEEEEEEVQVAVESARQAGLASQKLTVYNSYRNWNGHDDDDGDHHHHHHRHNEQRRRCHQLCATRATQAAAA